MSIKSKLLELELCISVSNKILKVNREIRITWAGSSRGARLWSLGPCGMVYHDRSAWQRGLFTGSQEATAETCGDQGPSTFFISFILMISFPLRRTYLLKLLPPQAGGQTFDIQAFGGPFSTL